MKIHSKILLVFVCGMLLLGFSAMLQNGRVPFDKEVDVQFL